MRVLNPGEIDEFLVANAATQEYPGVFYSMANQNYLQSRQENKGFNSCSLISTDCSVAIIGATNSMNHHSYYEKYPSLLVKNKDSNQEQIYNSISELLNRKFAKSCSLRMCESEASTFMEIIKANKKIILSDFSVHALNIVSLDREFRHELKFRSAHKQSIKISEKLVNVRNYVGQIVPTDIFSDFRTLYESQSDGFAELHNPSWEILDKQIANGNALLSCGYVGKELVGCAYSLILGSNAYYAMGVSKRDKYPLPISHSIIRDSMRELSRIGVNSFELGEVWSSKNRTPKMKGIEGFKSGFKGSEVFVHDIKIEMDS